MLTHDYDIIDYSRLWLYMEQYLPTLYEEAQQLVQQQERFFLRKTNANNNGGIAIIFR